MKNNEEQNEMNTIAATENSLMIENDVHPFDEDLPKTVNFFEQMHPVLVDGIKGKACTGTLGGYSDRIRIIFGRRASRLRNRFSNQILHVP